MRLAYRQVLVGPETPGVKDPEQQLHSAPSVATMTLGPAQEGMHTKPAMQQSSVKAMLMPDWQAAAVSLNCPFARLPVLQVSSVSIRIRFLPRR